MNNQIRLFCSMTACVLLASCQSIPLYSDRVPAEQCPSIDGSYQVLKPQTEAKNSKFELTYLFSPLITANKSLDNRTNILLSTAQGHLSVAYQNEASEHSESNNFGIIGSEIYCTPKAWVIKTDRFGRHAGETEFHIKTTWLIQPITNDHIQLTKYEKTKTQGWILPFPTTSSSIEHYQLIPIQKMENQP